MDLIFKGGLFDECGASIFGRRSCRRGGIVGGGGGVDGPVGILLLLLLGAHLLDHAGEILLGQGLGLVHLDDMPNCFPRKILNTFDLDLNYLT